MEEFEKMLKKLNIKENGDGEGYIGKAKDIIQLYLYVMQVDINEESENDWKEVVNDIGLINDILQELVNIDENMTIETYYNPMGAFTYKKYNEEEEE
jgi:hypothetical protein